MSTTARASSGAYIARLGRLPAKLRRSCGTGGWALSSAEERRPYKAEVGGSRPSAPTRKPRNFERRVRRAAEPLDGGPGEIAPLRAWNPERTIPAAGRSES